MCWVFLCVGDNLQVSLAILFVGNPWAVRGVVAATGAPISTPAAAE